MAQYTDFFGGGGRTRLFTPISLAISRDFSTGSFVFEAGYHPRKRTFKTHPELIDPKYALVHILFYFFLMFLQQNIKLVFCLSSL